jgi:hypothetical protein
VNTGPVAAVIEIFTEYCEILLDRLNRAPDHRRLAFLDHIGVSRKPPQPARVPLQVTLAAGTVAAAVVDVGTQVASAPAPLQPKPVVFETESELVVTAAVLDRIYVRDPAADQYADLTPLLSADAADPKPVFLGAQPIDHAFFIGHGTFFGQEPLDLVTVSFDLEASAYHSSQIVMWEIWDGVKGVPLQPVRDGTAGLTQSGDVEFQDVPVIPEAVVDGRSNRWLRCRLNPPLSHPTIIRSVTLTREAGVSGLAPDSAKVNDTQADLTKDFLPFGSQPRFGDVLYLSSGRAFALTGATVTLRFALTNPSTGDSDVPIPRVNAAGRARLAWEYWDGSHWRMFGTGKAEEDVSNETSSFSDKTRALTSTGDVTFRIPPDMQPASVQGKKDYWIRARLAGGDYGRQMSYIVKQSKPGVDEYVPQPATLAPPMVETVEIAYSLRESARVPSGFITYDDFAYHDETANVRSAQKAFPVFRVSSEQIPSISLGFLPPEGLGMPSLPTTVYFAFGSGQRPSSKDEDPHSPSLVWQYWNGRAWQRFGVADRTRAFSYSGTVSFIAPHDAQKKTQFGAERYWVRAIWRYEGDMTSPLRRVLPNTTTAIHGVTMQEVLGNGTGLPGQVFRTSRQPVLEGERVEVQEAGVWQMWFPMPDFLGSDSNSHHYMIAHMTGDVLFGDGARGKKPPAGSPVRISYRTGGGSAGNLGCDTLVQLKTTIPYVKGITNPEPAEGGADAESMDTQMSRAPAILRHGFRAVAKQDYEDLALIASPGVARALCIPLVNLKLDPGAERPRPGAVSLIIVPVSNNRTPQPTIELLDRVGDYLEQYKAAGVELVLVGPEHVEISVTADVGLASLEHVSALEMEIQSSLSRFLHPLYGGFHGKGWDFGREPHRSDLISRLQSLPGVDHVRRLVVRKVEERPGASRTGHFLACPGQIEVSFTVE